ncbi:MAG: hypothetical protein AAB372_01745 [Patescibacteria group bacterium]
MPSKKILFAITLALTIIGGTVFVSNHNESQKNIIPKHEAALKAEVIRSGKDWQNTLSDNQSLSGKQFTTNPEQNLFENLVRGYGETVISNQTTNLSQESLQNIADAVAADADLSVKANKNPYSATDVMVDQKETVKEYFNNVARISKKYFPDNSNNEILVIGKAAATKQVQTLAEELQSHHYSYSQVAKELARVHVPPEAVEVHVAFLNSFANVALAIDEISAFSRKDPLTGVLGMENYKLELIEVPKIFAKAKALAQANHIVFASDEPGYELQKYFDKI